MDRFYYLDKQDITEISCHIVVPLLNEQILTLRTQFKDLEKNIKLVEDISEFGLVYDKTKKLKFHECSLDVQIISDDDIADLEKMNNGISMVKQGFQMQIDGVVGVISGLFACYSSPKQSDYEFSEISINGDNAKFVFKKDNLEVTDVFTKEGCFSTMIMPTGKSEAKIKYIRVHDKFIIDSFEINLTQDGMTTLSTYSIEYQDINNLIFPSKIATKSKTTLKGTEMTSQFDILFTDYKVKGK